MLRREQSQHWASQRRREPEQANGLGKAGLLPPAPTDTIQGQGHSHGFSGQDMSLPPTLSLGRRHNSRASQ